MSDTHRAAIRRVAHKLQTRGQIPSELQERINALVAAWDLGVPDEAMLLDGKLTLWAFLEDKHGDSTTIADLEDRSVRASLCLCEPPGENHPQDLEEWATDMLGKG